MTRAVATFLGLAALHGLSACSVQQQEVQEEPLIVAEPLALEPLPACTGDESDDGIGGTGCEPVVAKRALALPN